MQIVPDAEYGKYHLKFVLMQVGKPDSIVMGSVALTIDGLMQAKPRSLTLADVSPNRRVSLAYSFRYFQDYDEHIQLPKGFEPTRVGVEIRSGRDVIHSFQQAFVWKAQGMSVETEANSGVGAKGGVDVQAETE
jgi:hypothetical protein